jgi:hypothetical protein
VPGAYSASWDNNYELVDFAALETGKYKIAVYKKRADESSNYLGIAWAKDATYLPDLRNQDGWASRLYMHNAGAVARYVTVNYFDPNGNPTPKGSDACYLQPNQSCYIDVNDPYVPGRIPPGTRGSAIIDGGEDVTAIVQTRNGWNYYSYSGVAGMSTANVGWGEVGSTIRLPLLMDNNSGWSTYVTVFNAGSGTASIDLDYFAQGTGGSYQGPTGNLAPGASATYSQLGSTCPTIGAGRITSNQPLAVTVWQVHSSNVSSAYNGFSSGATTVGLPLVMANNSGWYTGIAIQNLGASRTTATVHYDPQPGYPSIASDTVTVDPNRTAVVAQLGSKWGTNPWIGSARVTASQPVAAIVNQNTSGRLMSYSGFVDGTVLSLSTHVRNSYSGWTSGLQIQNLESSTENVVVRVGTSQT